LASFLFKKLTWLLLICSYYKILLWSLSTAWLREGKLLLVSKGNGSNLMCRTSEDLCSDNSCIQKCNNPLLSNARAHARTHTHTKYFPCGVKLNFLSVECNTSGTWVAQ
jgi:hypothetical protein